MLNEQTLQLCCLKQNTFKTKHTQFQTNLNICGKLNYKLTKKITKDAKTTSGKILLKKDGLKTLLKE